MKLYTFDSAPNPARVKAFIDYKGIVLDTEQIDMMKSEHQSDAYTRLVPEATVPALILEDGTVLTEVIAIVHYLEMLYPERPLLGVTPVEKATILNWNHRLFNMVFAAVAEAFRNAHPAFKDRALPGLKPYPQIPELAERGRTRLHHGFETLDGILASRDFVAGSQLSFADIDLLTAISFAGWAAREEPSPALAHLAAWRVRAGDALAT